jgi:SH3-like domain-containing protein
MSPLKALTRILMITPRSGNRIRLIVAGKPHQTARPRISTELLARADRLIAAVHESAIGTKRTFLIASAMSAFGGKADMVRASVNVAFRLTRLHPGVGNQGCEQPLCELHMQSP